ncbi:MAG: hypothetical protein ACXW27_02185 [Allosphingosinicella sp.]
MKNDSVQLAHPLDLTIESGFSLFSVESVNQARNNIDDCASSATSFSSAGGCAATLFCYACIISCGS